MSAQIETGKGRLVLREGKGRCVVILNEDSRRLCKEEEVRSGIEAGRKRDERRR